MKSPAVDMSPMRRFDDALREAYGPHLEEVGLDISEAAFRKMIGTLERSRRTAWPSAQAFIDAVEIKLDRLLTAQRFDEFWYSPV